MALNEKYEDADQFAVPYADVVPTDAASGDAVLVGGALPAVALTDMWTGEDGVDQITVRTDGAHHLEVNAAAGALGWGNEVFIDATSGALSNTSGVHYGYALGDVASAATTTIPVKIGF